MTIVFDQRKDRNYNNNGTQFKILHRIPYSHEDLCVEKDEGKYRQGHSQDQSSPICVIPALHVRLLTLINWGKADFHVRNKCVQLVLPAQKQF